MSIFEPTIAHPISLGLPYMQRRDNAAYNILKHATSPARSRRGAPDSGDLPPEAYRAALKIVTEGYDEARRMNAFLFDVLGFESSAPQTLALADAFAKYQWSSKDGYPPHLSIVPPSEFVPATGIFDLHRLSEISLVIANLPGPIQRLAPDRDTKTMNDLESFNLFRHTHQTILGEDMYTEPNIGILSEWYTDAIFAQQYLTGTNPMSLTLASPEWIKRFAAAAKAQNNHDVESLLSSTPAESLYVVDYSYFRVAMGAKPSEILSTTSFLGPTKYGCATVTLFILPDSGKLHPLAIIPDFKGGMDASVTIFNKRLNPDDTSIDQSKDWPWRYAKTCVQVSDFAHHEIVVHLNNAHFIEEALIVAGNRSLDTSHIVYRLLKPHWQVTLSLNSLARSVLVPNVIEPITGYKNSYIKSLLNEAFTNFDWKGLYVPNDLEKRGFPLDKLDDPKFHNYAYARDMIEMWKTVRKFVASVLRDPAHYPDDTSVAKDPQVQSFAHEMHAQSGAGMVNFPTTIETLDELIDIVTMCIHIAAPQHTAINYLQQFYQTFPANKSSALYAPIPDTLEALHRVDEAFLVKSLPVGANHNWLLMTALPYLLSMPIGTDGNILTYANVAAKDKDQTIAQAGKQLTIDLHQLALTFNKNSSQLDNQEIPYDVLQPEKTAVAIVI